MDIHGHVLLVGEVALHGGVVSGRGSSCAVNSKRGLHASQKRISKSLSFSRHVLMTRLPVVARLFREWGLV